MTLNRIQTLLLALVGGLLMSNASLAQTVAYTDATIETMGDQGQLKNATLVVRDDKIVDVGTDVKIPDDARIVSMSGKTILPGMIDPYFVYETSAGGASQTVTFNGRSFTLPGRNSFSVSGFNHVGDYFYPYNFDFKPALRSGITVANLVTDGRGQSALANIAEDPTPEMLMEPEGQLFAKVTNQTSALDIIRKPLNPASSRPSATSRVAAIRAGAKNTKSATTKTPATTSTANTTPTDKTKPLWDDVREGNAPLFVNVNNSAAVAYVLQIVKEHEKVKLVLVASGPNVFESLDEIKSNKNITVVLQPGIDRVPFTTDLMNVSQMLAAKKIPFAISMSLSNSQLKSSQDDPMFPLAMLVRTGLDRATALESVTIKPAQLLGIEKTHGSLENDKMANFLVFDGDPMQTGTRLQQVILNGKQIHED